ncbi:MAG: 50S ribosomal protein L5 [Candidatus Makana argininalis]
MLKKLNFYYKKKVIYILINKFKYSSVMQVPNIKKITINMGIGRAYNNKKLLNKYINDLTLISGQKPIITQARKSISSFKIRKGNSIGCKVTLRSKRMWDFLERFINIAVPRIRDFRGFSLKSFDGRGNYNIGLSEQIIFPEIKYDKTDNIKGLDISITTTALSDNEGYELLSCLNIPFDK